MNLINSIKNTITFDYNTKKNNFSCIHIGYGIDNNFARCTGTSITSFCINNPSNNFHFHILISNISSDNIIKFKLLSKKYSTIITIYEIDTFFLENLNLPTKQYWKLPTYFRFILPQILKEYTKLFYIDADIICINDATSLFNINLDNNIIAAVAEPNNKIILQRCSTLNLKRNIYFNAGMLIINIKKWNQLNIFKKLILELQTNPDKLECLDQDALNIVLQDNVKYIQDYYNYLILYNRGKNLTLTNSKIILLHFAAIPKPWHLAWTLSPNCNSFTKNIYKNYEDNSPWKNTPLVIPSHYKDIRRYAKYLKQHKLYLKSLKWYIKYSIAKIKQLYIK